MTIELKDIILNSTEVLEDIRRFTITEKEIMIWSTKEPRPKTYETKFYSISGGTR